MSEPDRVSIWSIAGDWRVVFYILFSVEVVVIIALVGWREILTMTDDSAVDTVLAIGTGAAPNIFTAAAINIAVIFQAEVITMLAERYKRHRYEVGKEEGIKLGRAQERARSQRYAARLRAWTESRIKAAEEGVPFDEPMPNIDDADDEIE